MLLRSQGPVDQLDTTQLSPAGRYVRSYAPNGQCNVNAGYHTVSLQIKERRSALVFNIVAILGNDPRYWFEPSLRPVGLPVRPLDWSTTLLQQLCIFAQSLPCDPRNTSVDERLSVAHGKMLADVSESSRLDNSADCVKTHQFDKPSWNSNKDHEFSRLRAWNQNLFERVHEVSEGFVDLHLYNNANDIDVGILEGKVSEAITKLSKCLRELNELRKQTASLERE
jgi:hypothetical protein